MVPAPRSWQMPIRISEQINRPVIENIREQIHPLYGEVHFETRMDTLILKDNEVVCIETNTERFLSWPVILATGHSARDVHRYLYEQDSNRS